MLYTISKYIWLLWCWLEFAVLTVFMYALTWMPIGDSNSAYHHLFLIWCRFFVRAMGVDLKLHQKNIVPLPKQYILISNHPSAFEDVGVPSLFNVYPLAKNGVKHWIILGRIAVAAGTVFVKRDSDNSRHSARDLLIQILNSGKNIAIFAEGGCKGRRIFSSFRYGAFDVSIKTGVPILPVFIHYEAQETFEWQDPDSLLDKIWHFITSQNNRANYYVYDAIDPSDFKDKQAFSEHVHAKYLEWQQRYLD